MQTHPGSFRAERLGNRVHCVIKCNFIFAHVSIEYERFLNREICLIKKEHKKDTIKNSGLNEYRKIFEKVTSRKKGRKKGGSVK